MLIIMSTWTVFKDLVKNYCLIKNVFNDNGKKLDSYISDKDYLKCKKIWNEFNMKNMGDYHDHMGDYHESFPI